MDGSVVMDSIGIRPRPPGYTCDGWPHNDSSIDSNPRHSGLVHLDRSITKQFSKITWISHRRSRINDQRSRGGHDAQPSIKGLDGRGGRNQNH